MLWDHNSMYLKFSPLQVRTTKDKIQNGNLMGLGTQMQSRLHGHVSTILLDLDPSMCLGINILQN